MPIPGEGGGTKGDFFFFPHPRCMEVPRLGMLSHPVLTLQHTPDGPGAGTQPVLHDDSANAAPTCSVGLLQVHWSPHPHPRPTLSHALFIPLDQGHSVFLLFREITKKISASRFLLRDGGRETSDVTLTLGDSWRLPPLGCPTEAGKDELPPFPSGSGWEGCRPPAVPCGLHAFSRPGDSAIVKLGRGT